MNQVAAFNHDNPRPSAQVSPTLWDRFRTEGMCNLGDSYIAGRWDCEDLAGTLAELFTRGDHQQSKFHPPFILNLLREILFNPQRGSGVFVVGERHYDLGNDLFTAMLDTSMTYTSGLWSNAQTLNEAQEHKLSRIAKLAHLAPGMRVLDIGCGWGNFAEYAARNHGVSVVGVTISKEQAEYARARCKGLPVEIRLQDYRSVKARFDAVVSIEMIEAVGRRNIATYFRSIYECLNPGGAAALQAISADTMSVRSHVLLDQYILWLLRHIFPNGYLPQLHHLTVTPERAGLKLQELSEYGADYDKTLMAWTSNIQAAWPELRRRLPGSYDDQFLRMWLFYLQGCAALFRTKLVTVYQLGYRKI